MKSLEQTYQAVALERGRCSNLSASVHPLFFYLEKEREDQLRHASLAMSTGTGGISTPINQANITGWETRGCADAEADMPSAEASGAMCVQRFDGSRNSAIHTTYRISLRSSSIREPRYPLLRVVFWFGDEKHDNRIDGSHTKMSSEAETVGMCWEKKV